MCVGGCGRALSNQLTLGEYSEKRRQWNEVRGACGEWWSGAGPQLSLSI